MKYINFLWLFLASVISSCFYHSETDANTTSAVAILNLDKTKLLAEVVATDLEVPWDFCIGPDGYLWLTEQKGTVSRIDPATGKKKVLTQIKEVMYKRSQGLFSIALHPDFKNTPFVYTHYVYRYKNEDLIDVIESRLVRFSYQKDTLIEPLVLLDKIPGKTFHNGSRIVIQGDKLFLSLGDAGAKNQVQDWNDLRGKVLRMNLDGSIPTDNPFPNNYAWTKGHRNVQGLVSANGFLYASEHGVHQDDEVNLLKKGGNYGWSKVEGFCDQPQEEAYCRDSAVVEPLYSYTPTLGVSGLDYYKHTAIPEWNNSLLLANLKGQALRVLSLDDAGTKIIAEKIYFQNHFGRIRDIDVDENGAVYFSTSNKDWHPRLQAWMYDTLPPGGDRIIRLRQMDEKLLAQFDNNATLPQFSKEDARAIATEKWGGGIVNDDMELGQQLYLTQCASCHRPDGKGSPSLVPTLVNTDWVTGDKARLIQILLKGLSDPITVNGVNYEQEMPGFAALSDAEIAAVINYIRTNFGNDASLTNERDVKEERIAL